MKTALIVMCFVSLMLLVESLSAAEPMTLSFDPPVEREDGTALDPATEIAEYVVYCRDRNGDSFPDTGYGIPGLTNEGEHETTYTDLLGEPGRYECAMTAVDTDGRESDYSNVIGVTWLTPPGRPTNIIIIRE